MISNSLRMLLLSVAPITLTACAAIEPATGSPIPTAPVVGVDLGSSDRVPRIAELVGEGEGYGRTEPNPSPMPFRSMPEMSHASMGRGSMPGMSHGSISDMKMGSVDEMPMDHGSMPAMSHGSMGGMRMDHGSMPGMRQGSMSGTQATQDSMAAMKHPPGHGMQMAHSGHAHAKGTGTVNSVDAGAHKVNVSHGPIPAIGFPAMTMDFAVAPSVDLQAVKPGTRVNFTVEQGEGGVYVIQSITPAGGGM